MSSPVRPPAGGRAEPAGVRLPSMLGKLRHTLSKALDALEGGGVVSPEEIDRILAGMREELIEARAALRKREEEVEDFERRLAQLRDRPELDPTQLAELEAEVEGRRAEVEEEREEVEALTDRFQEAVRRRDILLTRDRRTRAAETMRESGEEEIRQFEQVEAEIHRDALEAEAERELEEELEGGRADRPAASEEAFRQAEADEMLRELKRRMGMEPEE